MTPTLVAARAGVARGLIEIRQMLTNGQDLFMQYFWPVVILVVLFFMRDSSFGDTGIGLGALALPGVVGMLVASSGIMGIAQFLSVDREDGTLLRAKATPNGMVGYLIGKIITSAGTLLVQVIVMLAAGAFIVGGLHLDNVGAWVTLIWAFVLGVLATLPMGAVFGSIFDNPRNVGFAMMPVMGLIAVSGIFYPITSMPGWIQGLAQVFPIYWLGLGMRSALLDGDAAVVELGRSWRHWETFGVLSIWTVAGLALAPIVLRRMARRESGSSVAARREKAMQRAY
ncbi:ABC-2 type transport system permease protein [Nocardia transvalensis]|uniref:ABC-2 type transport system permease protein n=1 Tax=Nocardia transvalensis TaxID=37333 RepID=A0A7W9PD69_9NOCA|nr:ABC transporter permease [Nocardia transvalensis]MBB5914006.1 ABC-2 type transport system permease protein [Nocardia transvalensis]